MKEDFNPAQQRIIRNLEDMRDGSYVPTSSAFRDAVIRATNHGVLDRETVANALQCDIAHVNNALSSTKPAKIKTLMSRIMPNAFE